MTYWAIGRLAVIALTGALVFAAVPAFAACSGDKCTDNTSVSKPAAVAMPPAIAEVATSDAQDPVVQVVNADELNELDKAASDVTEPLPKLPPSIANSRAEMREDRASPWSQTSAIGKAFIAFGVMLTMASAARMFMA